MEKTQHEATRLPAWELPAASTREEADAYILELEMPGVSKSGIEITVENHELTITGHRSDKAPEGCEVVWQESHVADFRRTFELDMSIDTSRIIAKMEHGVLHLTLPKAESIKPRRITVGD